MPARTATARYLERHAEAQAHAPWPFGSGRFDHSVIVPAFDESGLFIDKALARDDADSWLLIVVVNARCNTADAALARTLALLNLEPGPSWCSLPCTIGRAWRSDSGQRGLWLIDAVSAGNCFDADQGVGLARKMGLDIALAHVEAQRIGSSLLWCSDADATWPTNYFDQQIDTTISALTFDFHHSGALASCAAQIVYDQRLRDYPRELTRAGSPYGFQALGSAMAVSAAHYAQVGGCPRRLAGEDFHLLAKLSKVGRVEHRPATVITLRARQSERVPFGTGPGVRNLNTHGDPEGVPFFIATRSFDFLGRLIEAVIHAAQAATHGDAQRYLSALCENDSMADLSGKPAEILELDALRIAVTTARDASPEAAVRVAHVMTWFDGLKTLRLLHRLRDAGWANVSYRELRKFEPERLRRGRTAGQEEVPADALGSSPSMAGSSDSGVSDAASVPSD